MPGPPPAASKRPSNSRPGRGGRPWIAGQQVAAGAPPAARSAKGTPGGGRSGAPRPSSRQRGVAAGGGPPIGRPPARRGQPGPEGRVAAGRRRAGRPPRRRRRERGARRAARAPSEGRPKRQVSAEPRDRRAGTEETPSSRFLPQGCVRFSGIPSLRAHLRPPAGGQRAWQAERDPRTALGDGPRLTGFVHQPRGSAVLQRYGEAGVR